MSRLSARVAQLERAMPAPSPSRRTFCRWEGGYLELPALAFAPEPFWIEIMLGYGLLAVVPELPPGAELVEIHPSVPYSDSL